MPLVQDGRMMAAVRAATMARDDFKFIVDEDGGIIAGFFELASMRFLKKADEFTCAVPTNPHCGR